MRERVVIVGLMWSLLTSIGWSQNFILLDKDGKKHGPFIFGNNQVIEVNGQRMMIKTRDLKVPKEVPIETRLNSIRIPEVKFRDVDIRDAVEFFRTVSKEKDPQGVGVNFVIMPGLLKSTATKDGRSVVKNDQYPRITMDVRNVTLAEAIKFLDLGSNRFKVRVQNNAVVFVPQ